ncbi:hypothetical protein JI735_20730 [Paenibacillus sonchi]|uniref:Uncharacterized protein n=1 Tax=Paenibacillus sonchi TaxID=373687 RepID=A0A974P902_9BACL|nr:hypothetical protein [Paenibacillus sonchi]QQZ59121.1 hypothetical protein JI735_20730 [Paenibacillus sonchi]
MKNGSLTGNFRQYIILSLLLLAFILGFYGLGGIYALSSISSRTVVLENSEFNTSLTSRVPEIFEIKGVTKLTNDFPIYDLQVLDHNNVIFQVPDTNSFSDAKIAELHLDNNQLSDIAENAGYGMILTPDAKQLIYTKAENIDGNSKIYMYNLELKKETKQIGNYLSYYQLFIDNERYFGFTGSEFTLNNVTTSKVQQLLSYDQLLQLLADASGSSNLKGITIIAELTQKANQDEVYLLADINNKSVIFALNLNNTNKVKLVAQGEQIGQFLVMKNGNLLVQGKIENKDGLFLYNQGTGKYKLLQEGFITNLALHSDESRIAYFLVNSNQMSDLHTVNLDNESLNSDTVIYRNIPSVQTMKWYQDDLFISGSQLNKSEIYRFTF